MPDARAHPPTVATEALARIASALGHEPGVGHGKPFSAPALTVGRSIFAMAPGAGLVLKLPAARCSALIGAGEAVAFRTGTRAMREWVVIGDPGRADLLDLAAEALEFVRGRHGPVTSS